jgi:hypothetical protein
MNEQYCFKDNILLIDVFLLLSFESFEELLYEVPSGGVDEDELFIFGFEIITDFTKSSLFFFWIF